MRCCIIYKEDYPWDVRVQKIADTLAADGHEVVILCRNLDQLPATVQMDGYEIRRLPALTGWPSTPRKIVNVPLWFNPFWIVATYSTVRSMNADTVIVRDLPLTFTAILIGRLLGARVVFDMAECYPEMYASSQRLSKKRGLTRFITRVAKNPTLAALYERLAVRLADKTLVMIEESRDRLLAKGVAAEKIHIVSNTPVVDTSRSRPKHHEARNLKLIYVGLLARTRGLDYLLHAVHEYVRSYAEADTITVDIVGKGGAREELERLTDELRLGTIVTLHGWLSHDEVARLHEKSNVGVLTYPDTPHWNNTIPNKLFDYMLNGVPVLATDVAPIARIIRNTNAGVICQHGNTRDVAEKIARLRDPTLRTKLGMQGGAAVLDQYNWESESRRLRLALHPNPPVDRA